MEKQITDNLFKTVNELEKNGVIRESILSLVKPQLEELDKKSKGLKESIKDSLKTFGAKEATKICNTLAATVQGAADAMRKRLQRRRSMLKSCLEQTFTEYDFSMEKSAGGKSSGRIVCEKVGDESQREANKLVASVKRIQDIFGTTDTPINFDDISQKNLAELIREGKQEHQVSAPELMDTESNSTLTRYYKEINSAFSGLVQEGKQTKPTEKKKEKVA